MVEATILPEIDAEAASAIAESYLANEVGNLLMAADPRLAADGSWVMSIVLGNAVEGILGEVGTIAVDGASGRVRFDQEERAKVKANARALTRAAPL